LKREDAGMGIALELPDELVREVQHRADESGERLGEVVVRLLSKGLEAERAAASANADDLRLARRRELTQKFISGELGVELAGIEECREEDRRRSEERAHARREA